MTYARAALAGLVLLAVAACSGGDPADGEPTTTGTPSASPSPTPTLAPPTIPPEASDWGAEGAAAFVEYWYAAQRYSAVTGDVSVLTDVTDPECRGCAELAENYSAIHQAGGYYEDLPWSPTVTASVAERDYFAVLVDVDSPRYRYRKVSDGPFYVVKAQRRKHLIRVRSAGDGWRVLLLSNQDSERS
ncbi:hypothetical protein FE697_017185 [Mumia zhuanghuii]|uniref:DUF6318 family protein n=2 Tax=Mumia TaxID=1546255 RepID=A0ABW1QQ40_9ACTN|nr:MULTISPECIES: DUF6318 family protein [Mumia]KAA1420677.1 hypothetical protein FE697_017185 [Mumia zhuanghuii]